MKLSHLYENQLAARRYAYIAKHAPSTQEIGWLGHDPGKRFKGDREKVQIKFDPSDPQIKDKYVYHTHPIGPEGPNPLRALPSEEDLILAINNSQYGLTGLVIYNGQYYTIVVPTTKMKDRLNTSSYDRALKRGDIEDSIKALERMGFDIETGQI